MQSKLFGLMMGMAVVLVSIQSSAIEPVIGINTDTYAATRNFKHPSALIHEYKVGVDGQVYWRIEGERPWSLFPRQPVDVHKTAHNTAWRVENIAADNNRIMVLARERDTGGAVINSELYWFCVYEDMANWVVDLLDKVPPDGKWRTLIDRLQELLKSPINEEAYRNWVLESHQGLGAAAGKWEKLYKLPDSGTVIDDSIERELQPNLDTAIDIAVGNWDGTVVTYYVYGPDGYGNRKIFYIDEEPMMTKWNDISSKNHTIRMDELQDDPAGALADLIRYDGDIITQILGDGWQDVLVPVVLPPPLYVGAFTCPVFGWVVNGPTRQLLWDVLPWPADAKCSPIPFPWVFRAEDVLIGILDNYDGSSLQTLSDLLKVNIMNQVIEGVLSQAFNLDITLPSQSDQAFMLADIASVILYTAKHRVSGPEYPVGNSPLALLTDESRINASNSVIAVSVPQTDETAIYYIRYDYHHQPTFGVFPFIDWNEDAWNIVHLGQDAHEFGVNTHGQYDPRNDPTFTGWWYVPPMSVLGNEIYLDGLKGMLGSYPSDKIDNYPVSIAAWGADNSIEVLTSKSPSNFYPYGAPASVGVMTASGTYPIVYGSDVTKDRESWRYYHDGPLDREVGMGGDLLFMEPSDNTIHVTTSTGTGFFGPDSGMWIPSNGFGSIKENYFPADFNGDCLTDLGYLGGDNAFYVALSTGASFGAAGSGRWIDQYQFGGTWGKYYTGDFNGDGKDDLLFVEPSNNTIHVSLSTGAGFGAAGSGMWIPSNGFGSIKENYFTADFNGDGFTDLGYLGGNNGFYVALSTGNSFGAPGGGEWISPNSWGGTWGKFYTGDFNGDKKDDLMFMEPGDNTIQVSISDGTGFFGPGTGQWIDPNGFGSIKENYFVGDFNSDGAMDIGYLEGNHGFYVALSTGINFYGPGGGEWIEPATWGGTWGKHYVGGFSNGAGCDDLNRNRGLAAHFTVTTDWGSGYCVTLDVTNNAAGSTTGWSVTYNVGADSVYNQWNANFSGTTGQITATPVSWNGVIVPGQAGSLVQVGFCVNRNGGSGLPSVINAIGTY